MSARRVLRTAVVVVAGLGCVLVAVGLGGPPGGLPVSPGPGDTDQTPGGPPGTGPDRPDPNRAHQAGPGRNPTPPAGRELRVAPSAATWVGYDDPARDTGPERRLRAGAASRAAVTYLKFEVPDGGPVEQAQLRLTIAEQPAPELVELVTVPDTGWDPAGLTWQTAPVLGRVVRSVRPDPDRRVTFDVTGAVSGPGVYAFAVTAPADQARAVFVGADRSPQQPTLRLVREPGGPPSPPAPGSAARCRLGEALVPTCGVLWGVAPAGHTGTPRADALLRFEARTRREQHIYHAYHRGEKLFPTPEELAIAASGRLLFLNWKPQWSWAEIAAGRPEVRAYLDRLADHIARTFPEPFFFTIHHEPENDVRPWRGSGYQAEDYAAMYRYVVERLRAHGADNLVTVLAYMSYVPWNIQPWFPDLYPGDDVVDWIAWDTYAYSDPGYGYGDFGDLVNRRSARYPSWPGFYSWAVEQFPGKPFMLAEWGVWRSAANPGHMADFYDSVARQAPLYPRLKALVYFDTPGDQRGRDSRPAATSAGLAAYQRLGDRPYFQVELVSRQPVG